MNLADIRAKLIAFLVSKAGAVSAAIASFLIAKLAASYHVYMGQVEVFFNMNDTDLNGWLTGIVFGVIMAGIGWLKAHWTTDANKKAQEIISNATGIPLEKDGVIGAVTLDALTKACAPPPADSALQVPSGKAQIIPAPDKPV